MVAVCSISLRLRHSLHQSQQMRLPVIVNRCRVARTVTLGILGLAGSTALPAQPTPRDAGNVVYKDAKSRASGEQNLHPLPSGRARLSGLYVTQDMQNSVGPGGNMYAGVTFRFYYFLPNGYAYMGAKSAGLESLQCDRPTVNEYGDPLCTTYSADNGEIRIGPQNPSRLRRNGNGLRIGDYDFALVPRANNLRLNGTYDYFAAGASAAVSSSFTFTRDGRFDGSNVTSVMVDTDPTNSGQTGGARVGVTGSSSASRQGTYRIDGYTLELNYTDGRRARAFFAVVAGPDVVRIGSRTYIKH
jgi:hypothetical protein